MNEQLKAKIVWFSGLEDIIVPAEMGESRHDQLQGTVGEKLSELCGRICYDSLGTGRNSASYHKHIREVGHNSTNEHYHITANFYTTTPSWVLSGFLNRKGVYIDFNTSADPGIMGFRITFNPRVLIDWDRHGIKDYSINGDVYKPLYNLMNQKVPQLQIPNSKSPTYGFSDFRVEETSPIRNNEFFMSVYMRGSRGFSHEQVRHRFNISQRSTRYVDESESEWIPHPLLQQYWKETTSSIGREIQADWGNVQKAAQNAYRNMVDFLIPYLVSKNVDPLTARKQARGAARGILGNALPTEMIFTASIADWKDMFLLRMSDPADAEIRLVYNELWKDAQNYDSVAERFREFTTDVAGDGIGRTIKSS